METNSQVPDPVFVFRGARSPVMSVTFVKSSEDDSVRYVAAGTQEGQVLIWDLKRKYLVKEWSAHPESSVLWMQSHHAGEIWTLGRHDKVKSWDITETVPKVLRVYSLEDYLGFSPCDIRHGEDSSLLAIPGPGQEDVTIFDVKENTRLCSLIPQNPKKYGNVMHMKWVEKSNEDVSLLVAYESGNISLWDHKTSKVISEINVGGDTPICFALHSFTHKGMIGTSSEKQLTFSLDENDILKFGKESSIVNPGVASCVVRPDGKIFVSGGWDFRIRLFSSKKMKPLAVLMYHKKTVECLSYSTEYVKYFDCQFLLAAGSSDMSVSLWKLFDQ